MTQLKRDNSLLNKNKSVQLPHHQTSLAQWQDYLQMLLTKDQRVPSNVLAVRRIQNHIKNMLEKQSDSKIDNV